MQSLVTLSLIALVVFETLLLGWVVVRRHPRPAPHRSDPHKPAEPAPPKLELSEAQLNELEDQARASYQQAVDTATKGFGEDLGATSKRLNDLIVTLTTDVVEGELEQYRDSLAKARSEALASLAGMQTAVEQRQQSLQGDLDAEIAKRRDYLIERLDRKLGESVSAYIVESLGQGADLGAQRGLLLESLERHKEELRKDLADGN